MRNGLTKQVVPESTVDFTWPTGPRLVSDPLPDGARDRVRLGTIHSPAERERQREIAVVLDTISVAAGNGDVDATLAAAARLASLRNRSPQAQRHYVEEQRLVDPALSDHLSRLAS